MVQMNTYHTHVTCFTIFFETNVCFYFGLCSSKLKTIIQKTRTKLHCKELCKIMSLVFMSIFFINTTGQMTPHLLAMCFPQILIIICIHVTVLCQFLCNVITLQTSTVVADNTFIGILKDGQYIHICTRLSSVAEYHIDCHCTALSSLLCITSPW